MKLSGKTDAADIPQNEKLLNEPYSAYILREWLESEDVWEQMKETALSPNQTDEQKHALIKELYIGDEITDKITKKLLQDGIEITPEMIQQIRDEENAYTREIDDFIYETLEKDRLKTPVVKVAGVITRETVPLLTGGAVGTGLGFGGIAAMGFFGLSAPVAIPIAAASVVGGVIWLGLRLGAPEFLEGIPLKVATALHKDDLTTEGGSFTNRKLIFRES